MNKDQLKEKVAADRDTLNRMKLQHGQMAVDAVNNPSDEKAAAANALFDKIKELESSLEDDVALYERLPD